MKDGAYVINLDEYVDVGTHWIALFCSRNEVAYFDSFGIEHIPKEIKSFIENKNIKTFLNKHFSSTSKRLSNVWVLLHWIH